MNAIPLPPKDDEAGGISNAHLRKVKRISKGIRNGRIVLEIRDWQLVSIDQWLQYIISPTEK